MRRLVAFILAVLVLALSLFPCNDPEAQIAPASEANSAIVMNAGVDDNYPAHHHDLCSPFCTCSCCSGITLPAPLALNVPQGFRYVKRPTAVYIQPRTEAITVPVWQPPQLV